MAQITTPTSKGETHAAAQSRINKLEELGKKDLAKKFENELDNCFNNEEKTKELTTRVIDEIKKL